MSRPKRSNPITMHQAGELRNELTPAERKLWASLRGNKLNGVNFRRQHAIGNYIVDFCSIKNKLIIELDGSHHLEQEVYDEERTLFLESKGYRVIRYWNSDVMNNIEGVLCAIDSVLDEK
ncbi:MAG: endonuclease domain-containing protein [Chloroflexota bacterium]